MPGIIVKTKSGKVGRTTNGDSPVFVTVGTPIIGQQIIHKVKIYLDDGSKIIADPKNLQTIGFWD